MPETLPDAVHRENEYSIEKAKHKETRMELELMKRKHSLLQNEIEALRVSLEKSGWFTWMWFLLSQLFLAILFVIFWDWLGF